MRTRLESLQTVQYRTMAWCRQTAAAQLAGLPHETLMQWHLRYRALPDREPGQQRWYRRTDLLRLMLAKELLTAARQHPRQALELAAAVLPEGANFDELPGRYVMIRLGRAVEDGLVEFFANRKELRQEVLAEETDWEKGEDSEERRGAIEKGPQAVICVSLQGLMEKLVARVERMRESGDYPTGLKGVNLWEVE